MREFERLKREITSRSGKVIHDSCYENEDNDGFVHGVIHYDLK